jgi:two-component system response regulator DesR
MTRRNLIISGKNRLFREGLKHILESPDMTVIGEISSLREVAAFLRPTVHRVDLMVCDASENTHQDFQVLQQIGQEFPEIGIIILTNDLSRSDLDAAIAGGARAFLPKSISPAALRTALGLILLGGNILAVPASLLGGIAAKGPWRPR